MVESSVCRISQILPYTTHRPDIYTALAGCNSTINLLSITLFQVSACGLIAVGNAGWGAEHKLTVITEMATLNAEQQS